MVANVIAVSVKNLALAVINAPVAVRKGKRAPAVQTNVSVIAKKKHVLAVRINAVVNVNQRQIKNVNVKKAVKLKIKNNNYNFI